MTIVLGSILIVSTAAMAWLFWPTDIFDKPIPGITVAMDVRIYDTPEHLNRPIFGIINNDGGRISLSLSSNNLFTCIVNDIYDDPYSVEAKLYRTEVPIDEPAMLFCEVGITDDVTVIRILVDGKEIRRRTVPIPLTLGNWQQFHSIREGGGRAIFTLQGDFIVSKALSNNEIHKVVENDARSKR